MKYEGRIVIVHRIIYNVTSHLRMLLKVRKISLEFPTKWPSILQQLSQLRPKVRVKLVLWELLEQGWCKYNINGASKGNPGRSSWAFCLRDAQRDLIHAQRSIIEDTDNMEVKANAILYAVIHCNQTGKERVII